MSWIVVGLILGILIGLNLGDAKNRKTFEQVDQGVRDELVKSNNLNESLMEDIKFLRNRIAFLEGKIK
jgi:hypothetical protein